TEEVATAEDAKAIGLVEDALPSAELLDHSRDLAQRIAKVSRQSVAAIKRVVTAGTNLPPAAISAMEEEAFAGLFGDEDQRARMGAFLASQSKTAEEG